MPADTPPVTSSEALGRPLVDALAAVVVAGVFWIPPTFGHPDWSHRTVGLVLAALVGAAVAVRRRMPVAATVIVGLATLLGTLLGVSQDPMLAAAWCLF